MLNRHTILQDVCCQSLLDWPITPKLVPPKSVLAKIGPPGPLLLPRLFPLHGLAIAICYTLLLIKLNYHACDQTGQCYNLAS